MSNKKTQRNGFYITQTDYNQDNCFVLQTEWRDSYESIIRDNQIKHIRLSRSAGWKEDRIDFIANISTLEGLEIYSSEVKDLAPLSQLSKLKHLALESDSIFDLSTITTLNIVNYPAIDLVKLKRMRSLKSLKLTSRKLNSLLGIEYFHKINSVDLFRCPKLSTLKNIDQCENIVTLEIESCKGIFDIDPVSSNKQLKRISINNCGEINSLIALKGLRNLEEIIFVDNTKILDGDLTFFHDLPRLKNTRFADRKHYSIKRDAFNSQLNQGR